MLDELTDRFGEPPYEVLNLLTVARIKAAAHEAFIASISYKNKQVRIEMAPEVKVKVDLLDDFLAKHLNNIRVVAGNNPGFVVDLEKKSIKSFIGELEGIIQEINELIER